MRAILLLLLFLACPAAVHAEDGYDLWLRYRPIEASAAARYAPHLRSIVVPGETPTLAAARSELSRGLSGLLAREIPVGRTVHSGAILVGTPQSSAAIRALHLPVANLGRDGFLIRTVREKEQDFTVIAANSDIGALYGTFAFLRLIQTRHPIASLKVNDSPAYSLRLLDHWDNLDRTVERGYAGPSIWDWPSLPRIERRYIDYARANASIGINGVALNNVNADPQILTPEYLSKVAALAGALRPYGIRVYLSVRFSSPIEVGGLKTSDPLDPTVRAWWRAKANEIYRLIPDFGGFVVKANSEGQPGPWDYHRTHADGANVIADALAPHGGTVFWRAFVYGHSDEDRAKQAYDEFKPLDGKFRDNVVLQVKNGPIDFQPREPFHPLFGQMPRTRVALEAQVTREYLGQGSGIVFLAPMWSEVLNADTCSPRCGTPVLDTIGAMAGVANVGSDRDWTGTQFDQANWYAFGRLAWNPHLTPASIAAEWTRMTWSNDRRALKTIVAMMLRSREAAVDYMTPLGLAHQMATGHHYGPGPWVCDLDQPSWNPCYYNRADADGIGFDRTASGSNAVAQYAPEVAHRFASLKTVPEKFLLWFHHLPWTYRMRSGRTLWDALVEHYDRGVASVGIMRREWDSVRPFIDSERFGQVTKDLRRQSYEARWWRDASIAYFGSLSKLPLPPGHSPPRHELSWYEAIRFDAVPGFQTPRIPTGPDCVPVEGGPPCAP